MKQGILYDYLQVQGGAEKVALLMLKYFNNSQLLVSSINSDNFDLSTLPIERINTLQKFSSIPPLRILKAIYSFQKSKNYINQFDRVIYSGFYAPLAINQRTRGNNFYYCHTPPRYLYDLKSYYKQKFNLVSTFCFRSYALWYQTQYERAIHQMDRVIANSKNVQKRLKKYLNIDSTVINPPVKIEHFQWISQGDYYLSLARLEPYKRVDMIIEAFKVMPKKKLIIASGGSDYHRLMQLAGSSSNIIFTGWCSDTQLVQLLGNAIASIYIAKEEDFGMSPVESQAAGKPVIGVAEGGLLETISHGETGFLIRKELLVDDIVDAIEWMSPKRALLLKNQCLSNATKYSSERFFQQIKKLLC